MNLLARSAQIRCRRRSLQSVLRVLVLLPLAIALIGCGLFPGAPASVSVTSQVDDQRRITGTFNQALYALSDEDHITIVLLRGSEQDPAAAVTIRMFWEPTPGQTPIDRNATNASVQYLVFGQTPELEGAPEAEGVGIYDGAGYLFLDADPGSDSLTAGLWQADLRLRDASDEFTDQLGQVIIRSDLTARRDDQAVLSLLRRLSHRATQRLGYPRLVRIATPPLDPVAEPAPSALAHRMASE